MNVAQWLTSLRAERRISQEQLAEMSCVPRSTIASLETGANPRPSVKTAKRLGAALHQDWTLFFDDERRNYNKAS